MGDLLKTGAAWLSAQMKAHVSRTVTYRRGQLELEDLVATIGRTEFEVFDSEQATLVKIETRDFIVDAADLVLNGQVEEPQRGDLILEADEDGKTRTYEVSSPAPRTSPWSWADSYHDRLRIHTKMVKSESTPE